MLDEIGRVVIVRSATVPQTTQADPTCTGPDCLMISFSKQSTRRITIDPAAWLPIFADERGKAVVQGSTITYVNHTDYVCDYRAPADLNPGYFTPPTTKRP